MTEEIEKLQVKTLIIIAEELHKIRKILERQNGFKSS